MSDKGAITNRWDNILPTFDLMLQSYHSNVLDMVLR